MKYLAPLATALALFTSAANGYRYVIAVPYGVTSWTAGTPANMISWEADPLEGPAPEAATVLGLWLYNNATKGEITIATDISASVTSYSWSIPSNLATSSDYSIRIGDPTWTNETYSNYSGLFTITAVPVTTTSSAAAGPKTTAPATTTTKASNSTGQDSRATERLTYTALLAVLPAVVIGTIGTLLV